MSVKKASKQEEKNRIALNIEAGISNELKNLKIAMNVTCGVSEADVEFVQDMLKENVWEDWLYAESAYTTVRQAIINYLLEREREMDLAEDLQLAVLETIKANEYDKVRKDVTLVMSDEEFMQHISDFEKADWWEFANMWVMHEPSYQVTIRVISQSNLTQAELKHVANDC